MASQSFRIRRFDDPDRKVVCVVEVPKQAKSCFAACQYAFNHFGTDADSGPNAFWYDLVVDGTRFAIESLETAAIIGDGATLDDAWEDANPNIDWRGGPIQPPNRSTCKVHEYDSNTHRVRWSNGAVRLIHEVK